MISIIVPVYNTPISDLQRCLKSIIAQTYSDWEAVIVDDGSSRETYDELDRWALAEQRFTVVHQENRGVSDARNTGIQRASGQYVSFCDADDRLKENFVSEAIYYLEEYKLDIVIGACEVIGGNKIKKYQCAENNRKPWIFGINGNKKLDRLLDYMVTGYHKGDNCELGNVLASRVCWKVFRKTVVEQIRFPSRICMHEDTLFAINAACICKRIGVVEGIWYEYYMNDYSATHKKGNERAIANEFAFARELCKCRKDGIRNAIDVRMIWTMKAICSILRNNNELRKICKRVVNEMLDEECFMTAVQNFDLSGYQDIRQTEKWFSCILRSPAKSRKRLLCLWTHFKI